MSGKLPTKQILLVGLLIFAAFSRLIPHPPNFTSLIALSFYVPAFLGLRYIPALIIGFVITDYFIGFHQFAYFNSENSVDVVIGTTVSTLHFPSAHKFRNIEKVTYNPQAQTAISGLTTNTVYYARVIDTQTVKLHHNEADALAGIGTVTLSALGEGTQRLVSYNPKNLSLIHI